MRNELAELLEFRYKLSKDFTVLILSYFVVIGTLYTTFQIVTAANFVLYVFLYGPITLMSTAIFRIDHFLLLESSRSVTLSFL